MSGAVGGYWISPHAVTRFQQRIAPLGRNHALAAIIKSLASPVSVKLQKDGVTFRIRTKEPWRFRAFVAPPKSSGELPCVVTLFEG